MGTGEAFFEFLRVWQIGDLTGILGTVGLGITFWQAWKARSAAEAAKIAAEGAQSRILTLETVVDLSSVVSLLDDVMRLHRQPSKDMLLDRYASIRKVITSVRSGRIALSDEHDIALQSTMTYVAQLQDLVEKTSDNFEKFDFPKHNRQISGFVDSISGALNNIKRDHARR